MKARGFTLAELMVALAIGVVVLGIAYHATHVMVMSERGTDRDASRALAEALVMEQLLQDMRSARTVTPLPNGYRIERHVTAGGAVAPATQLVTWELVDGPRVRRTAGTNRPQIYDFSTLIDPGDPPFKFQLEQVPDAVFQP